MQPNQPAASSAPFRKIRVLPAIASLTALWLAGQSLVAQAAPAPAPPQFHRPELVAIAWASSKIGPHADTAVRDGLTAWRPDQTPIAVIELQHLKSELRDFGTLGRVEDDTLPPLHLVFRIDERARDSQTLTPSLVVGQRIIETRAAQDGSSPQHLALAIVTPSRKALSAWPDEIDLELRVPIEESHVIRTVKLLPDSPLDIDPGVRLFWTQIAGPERLGRKVFPAVGLAIDRETQPLADYDFATHLTDETTESFNSSQVDGTRQFRVSPPLDSKNDVEHIDVTRLRYRTETYRKIRIFPERVPRDSSKPPG